MDSNEDVVFVYYREDNAAIVAITDDYDAVLAVEYAYFCMPRAMMDAINQQQPEQPKEGILYYDEISGVIFGVSMRPDTEMEPRYAKLMVAPELAMSFLTGEDTYMRYFIDPLGRLMRKDEVYELDIIDSNYVVLDEESIHATVMLRIRIATKDKTVAFKLDTLFGGLQLKAAVETFDVLLVHRDDPSVILETITVNLAELIEERLIVRAIQTDFKMHPAIFMKRFTPSTWLEVGDLNTDRMPLPMIGDSIVRFDRAKTGAEAALIARIDRRKGRIKITYNRDAGPLYDRPMKEFPILITRPKDPSFIITASAVPLEPLLKSGKAEIAIPKEVCKDEFDLHAPLLFKSMVAFDNGMK